MKKLLLYLDIKFIRLLKFKKNNSVIKLLSHIGSFVSIALFLIILFLISYFKVVATYKILVISIGSTILNTIIVFIMKYTIKRRRRKERGGIKYKYDPYSFPSGHISRLSGLIFPTIDTIILPFIFLFFSFTTSYSRMIGRYHYFSDCIVGFFVGLTNGIISYICYLIFQTIF